MVKEVCGYLRIHRNTLYGMIKAGSIPHFRVGREYFNREEIDAWSRSEATTNRDQGDSCGPPNSHGSLLEPGHQSLSQNSHGLRGLGTVGSFATNGSPQNQALPVGGFFDHLACRPHADF